MPIPRRHIYYKLTNTTPQKSFQVHVFKCMLIFFGPFCSNTYSHVFNLHDATKTVFFAFCSKLLGTHFVVSFRPWKNGKRGVYSVPVLQVCDGLCLNDLEKWILMDFGYLILDFLDFRCKKLNTFNLTGSVLQIFQTTTKWRAQLKLLQNESK